MKRSKIKICLENNMDNITLTELPYEIQEKILGYLITGAEDSEILLGKIKYSEVANYAKTNKKAMYICDNFLKMRAKKDNIPIKLLQNQNLSNRYINLYEYSIDLKKNELPSDEIIKKAIKEKDIDVIKWLSDLVIKRDTFCSNKVAFFMKSCYYALENNDDKIGEWFLFKLRKNNFVESNDLMSELYFGMILKYVFKINKIHIAYYMLDNFYNVMTDIKDFILNEFIVRNDLNNLGIMMNRYEISIDEYNICIARTKDFETLKFLLSRYPGTRHDLNKISINNILLTPENISTLLDYGLNYPNLIDNMGNKY